MVLFRSEWRHIERVQKLYVPILVRVRTLSAETLNADTLYTDTLCADTL